MKDRHSAVRMWKWRANNPAKRMLACARARAQAAGLEFDITLTDIEPVPLYCPVLGIKLKLEGSKKGQSNSSPTVDRVDNSKGYVRGNVVIISWRANRLKSDATMDELQSIIDFYDRWRA